MELTHHFKNYLCLCKTFCFTSKKIITLQFNFI